MKFLVLLLLIPLAEVAVFIEVGDEIGALWTVLLTIGTAALGIALVKIQGIRTVLAARQQVAQGQLPAGTMIEGVMLLLAGTMLLIPGFISDTLGFLLLIPAVRSHFAAAIMSRMIVNQRNRAHSQDNATHIIEGEFRRDD